MKTHYEILNIPQNASREEIERARDGLRRTYHPDKYQNSPDWVKNEAHEKFVGVEAACGVLLDSVKRAAYNQALSPPKPKISPGYLDFGVLTKGSKPSRKVVITNLGGTAANATLDLSNDYFAYEIISIASQEEGFCPIELKITVDTNQLGAGRKYSEWIEIDLDGFTTRVDLDIAVEAPVKATPPPKPAPATSPPTTSYPPTPAATPSSPPAVSSYQNRGLAVTSLVSGLVSLLCLGILTGPLAIITGFVAWRRANNSPLQYGGNGLAIGGMSLGTVGLLFNMIWIVPMISNWLPSLSQSSSNSNISKSAPPPTSFEVSSGQNPRWNREGRLYSVYEVAIPRGDSWLKTNIQLRSGMELRANFEDLLAPEMLSQPLSLRAGPYSESYSAGWGGTSYYQHYFTLRPRKKSECNRCTQMKNPSILEVRSPERGVRLRIELYQNTKF